MVHNCFNDQSWWLLVCPSMVIPTIPFQLFSLPLGKPTSENWVHYLWTIPCEASFWLLNNPPPVTHGATWSFMSATCWDVHRPNLRRKLVPWAPSFVYILEHPSHLETDRWTWDLVGCPCDNNLAAILATNHHGCLTRPSPVLDSSVVPSALWNCF